MTVREFIHSSLRKELSKSPSDVYFIGHSMAGALASYASLDFSIHSLPRIKRYIKLKKKYNIILFIIFNYFNYLNLFYLKLLLFRQIIEDEEIDDQSKSYLNKKIKVGMYTFGSPRVGNWSFSHFLNRIVPNSFRIGKLFILSIIIIIIIIIFIFSC